MLIQELCIPSGHRLYLIFFCINRTRLCMYAKSPQSCLTLCEPMDCSPPGSSVHGIVQARMLERVAMPSSRGSSQPRIEPTSPAALALQVSSLLLSLRGSPYFTQNSVYKLMLPSQFVPPSPFSLTVSTN